MPHLAGQSYRLHCRKPGTEVEGGELTLDDGAEEQLVPLCFGSNFFAGRHCLVWTRFRKVGTLNAGEVLLCALRSRLLAVKWVSLGSVLHVPCCV
jgi:hypothetical protein